MTKRVHARWRISLPIAGSGAAVMGAGDFLTELTTKLGVRPCGGCKRRAAALNRILELHFTGRKTRKHGSK